MEIYQICQISMLKKDNILRIYSRFLLHIPCSYKISWNYLVLDPWGIIAIKLRHAMP